jgi:uroporphyrinogen III methyltransferase / synthase
MSPPPLSGLRVLVTRPLEHSAAWADAFTAAGATVILYPTVEVVPPTSWQPLDEALGRLREYDWLVFTSAAAARFALARLPPDASLRGASRPRVAAVGRETARVLEEGGAAVALVPEEERQDGLAAALGDAVGGLAPGTRVLFPQAVGGREELRDALLARGCIVDMVPASQTLPRRDLPPPPPFDVATFASPSALRAFVALRGLAELAAGSVAVIGPTTAAAALALGLTPVVAAAPTAQDLVRAIAAARLASDHPFATKAPA